MFGHEIQVVSRTANRVRLRLPKLKGKAEDLETVKNAISGQFPGLTVEANPITGSLTIASDRADLLDLLGMAEQQGLFGYKKYNPSQARMPQRLSSAVGKINRDVKKWTGNEMDIPTLALAYLVISGIVQVARGNLVTPPWYTAFWYGVGVYSKTLLDKAGAMN